MFLVFWTAIFHLSLPSPRTPRGKLVPLRHVTQCTSAPIALDTYETAVARMFALGHELAGLPSQKFDLAHMRSLLAAVDNPERRFPAVLIAGTNGKGSTAATLASILQTAGYRTGLYTSPHLLRINERTRVNGTAIADADFAATHERVAAAAAELVARADLPWHPSFFEMLTAMAFHRFAEAQVDIAVLEVGMGGRLDATNVIPQRLCVITDIALDHQKYLGETIAEIAHEKAGIIAAGSTVVTLPQLPAANDVIGHAILECGARGVSAAAYVPPVSPNAPERTAREAGIAQQYPLSVFGEEILVQTPLAGRHQLRNLALAIAAAEQLAGQGFSLSAADIAEGIRSTRWPGRFQVLAASASRPEIVLDVAHNPAGVWSLRAALSERYGERPLTVVFGVMRDKAIGEMAEILFPLAERVIATCAANPRSATPEEICQAAHRISVDLATAPTVAAAIQQACQGAGAHGLVVITGSIYVVGEAMAALGIAEDARRA